MPYLIQAVRQRGRPGYSRLWLATALADIRCEASAAELIRLTRQDTKARGGRPKYVLPCASGSMAVGSDGAYGMDVQDSVAGRALEAKGALE